jgi:hypothetical protein
MFDERLVNVKFLDEPDPSTNASDIRPKRELAICE